MNQPSTRSPYMFRSGMHYEIAPLTSLLANEGIVDPESGAALSEAMVLGISGGVGMGYILWEFQDRTFRVLVIGMRNRWQYPASLYTKVGERLNISFNVAETGGAKGAQASLEEALTRGRPAMIWVDQAHLPWFFVPQSLSGHFGHTVVAYGADGDNFLIDDRTATPWRIGRAELAAARGRIGSYKNRMLTVEGFGAPNLNAAIVAGLRDCAEHLAQPSDSFSLPVIRKWARMMTDTRNAKGWPTVFADGRSLYSALISVFEEVTDYGRSGGNLRGLYADFLDTAATRLQQPALSEVARRYRHLGLQWSTLGETALPTQVPALAAAKELIARRHTLASALGSDGMAELGAVSAELGSQRKQYDSEFPLAGADRLALFAAIQSELEALYAGEVEANRLLAEAVAPL
ncbi:MAG: BtrH N-terminal domain-containing protein [Caldilineaceae bacterium]